MPNPMCDGGTRRQERRLVTRLARCAADVRAAQRLRYRVFAEECGALLAPGEPGLDRDAFDDACEHLLLWDEAAAEVVGTYRLLSHERARALGGFYSAGEFELGGVLGLESLVEIGRSCIDPRHRNGAALATLLAGLAALVRQRGWRHVIGCASIPVPAGDEARVVRLCARLVHEHAVPSSLRVRPYRPFLAPVGPATVAAKPPPLLRGYLRMGAWVCGPPAWDPAFRTADLLLLLPMARMTAGFAARLLRAA